jgi:hypothetical protein
MRTFTGLLVAAAVWAVPGTAAASCAEPPPPVQALEAAELVFVGTVVDLRNEQRTATVAVEEIWKGPAVPATVTVSGAQEPGVFTSVDRTFALGTTYVFILPTARTHPETGAFVDNACSPTRRLDAELAALAPAERALPITATAQPPGSGREDPPWWLLGLAAFGVAVGAAGVALARRRPMADADGFRLPRQGDESPR